MPESTICRTKRDGQIAYLEPLPTGTWRYRGGM